MTEDLHHLAAAYALDALDPEERRDFESHYATCEICTREVREFRETAGVLAESTATSPPAAVKTRVMAEVASTRQMSPGASVTDLSERRRWPGRLPMALAAAAAAVLLVLGTVTVVSDEPEQRYTVADLLAAEDSVISTLDGPEGTMRVVWSPTEQEAAVLANDIPAPGEGMTYELWFVLDDGVAPAGLFEPEDGRVRTVLDVDDVDSNGWGVSIEPEGGSEQPTGEVLYTATF